MKERSFDEMIAYFNRRVAEMDISQDCKMELLGMVTALGYKHEKSVPQWIPCSECMYWRDERVLMNNGKARQYNGDEPDELGIKHSVSVEVGINQGAMCLYEEDRGWRTDHTTFRNADDFCSRAKKRPCSYEEWYGIVDGVYAEPWRGEER